jgi:hypothetical protein
MAVDRKRFLQYKLAAIFWLQAECSDGARFSAVATKLSCQANAKFLATAYTVVLLVACPGYKSNDSLLAPLSLQNSRSRPLLLLLVRAKCQLHPRSLGTPLLDSFPFRHSLLA